MVQEYEHGDRHVWCPRCIHDHSEDGITIIKGLKVASACDDCGVCEDCEHMNGCEVVKMDDEEASEKHCPRCIEEYDGKDGERVSGSKVISACEECGVCEDCDHLMECSRCWKKDENKVTFEKVKDYTRIVSS